MKEDININMDIPKGHLIIVLLIMFLIGGLAIGYALGGYIQDKRWSDYNELREQYVNYNCICQGQGGYPEWKFQE